MFLLASLPPTQSRHHCRQRRRLRLRVTPRYAATISPVGRRARLRRHAAVTLK